MATKKDLVEAQSFAKRRLTTAFVAGAPGGREVEPHQPMKAIIGGIALSIVLVVGSLAFGWFKGSLPTKWGDDKLIIGKQSGARYVSIKDTLHPVINTTSARLLIPSSKFSVITVDDVVDVIEEEATEDIYRLAQVGEEASIHTSIWQAIRNRLPWLMVNLGTAFLASWVVSQFESTIAQVAVLAAFMPIVAGEGGNAGTQTMTIMVRSIALGELSPRDTWFALWHEFRTGFLNGLVLGILVGLIAWAWQGSPVLGLVIALAMWGNLIVAATVGVLVPMVLKLVRVDPALASGIFVTTFTDVFGFTLFLGLATYFLYYLRGL